MTLTTEVLTDNPVSNEYGHYFESATRALVMIKAGVIGDKWEVIKKDFHLPHGAMPYGDEMVPWRHICATITNGDDLYQVTIQREELEAQIDNMKLLAWVKSADESSQT